MVDIQSPTAEIRQGKKERRKKERKKERKKDRNHRQEYNGMPYYIGRP